MSDRHSDFDAYGIDQLVAADMRDDDLFAELVEALRATLNALEKLDAGETKIATRARALLAKIDGETA